MRKSPLLALALSLSPGAAHAEPPAPIPVAILDFDYVDTSGESRDQTADHARRLEELSASLRRDLAAGGRFRIVLLVCDGRPCAPRDPHDDVRHAAQKAGAKFLVFGGVHKMSTLVQWAKLDIADVETDRLLADRLLTFRGDNDEAWRRAENFMAQEIAAFSPAPAETPRRTPIAVFDFELEDFSGGGGVIPQSAADEEQLRRATEAARKLIAQSDRYRLVDVARVEDLPNSSAAKAHALRQCDGCDAPLAAKLGADRSLVGIVTRITRTDYAVTYRLRDARTGDLISVAQTDLRIGANYSWDRGAAWLIQRRLLAADSH
jgi:hypothetical protein